MKNTRFDYQNNLAKAGNFTGYKNALWPPASRYSLHSLDLCDEIFVSSNTAAQALEAIGDFINNDLRHHKNGKNEKILRSRSEIAQCMRQFSKHLKSDEDKRAVEIRASALVDSYTEGSLLELKQIQEEVALVVGQISTWYGKQKGGLPTVFACRRDRERQEIVSKAMGMTEEIDHYVKTLHVDLGLGELPAFLATQVFFMAGEGNSHPKHIAYFLPEDEGVKRSPFKKTYYFANTHNVLVNKLSIPLAHKYLDIGIQFDQSSDKNYAIIPTLGVLAHEMGHFVVRPETSFKGLNKYSRWASVSLQEICADVFGTLIVAEVFSKHFSIPTTQVIAYYLSECLRYIDRGLGYFPDSDGMYFQVAYLCHVGALDVKSTDDSRVILTGEPEDVVSGLRSMARVLADSILTADAAYAVELFKRYGPDNDTSLGNLIATMSESPLSSVEYTRSV